MGRITFSCILAMAVAIPAFAQSLVDVARQEEARRASVRVPSKVFTNSSLSPAPGPAPVAPRDTAPLPMAAASATPANSSAAAPAAKPAAELLNEKEWRTRAASLRARVAMATKELAALAGASHADPREQALLDRLRKSRQAALTQAEEALQLFEVQADATKVPKAWLQEPRE
ncbi:MAG: hypothetical protein WC815_14475 [Vicinamibacterales bacterium]|jgi:hypothetical protein